jgi:hypothetical protein
MKLLPSSYTRPRAYLYDFYQWQPLPKTIHYRGEELQSPLRTDAVFLVHGIGSQRRTETAVSLRSGFEDALVEIFKWQDKEREKPNTEDFFRADPRELPPPFIYEGYWAEYTDVEKTFPEVWKTLTPGEEAFFVGLWKHRTSDLKATLWWFLRQQLRLLNPFRYKLKQLPAWILYWPLQIVSLAALIVAAVRYRRVVTELLSDVRLYIAPRGLVERAIVQRVDRRVGEDFLKMIGLTWDFRLISKKDDKIIHDKKPITFERITWVAHSLGTVISYNVLSDLFARATEIEKSGDTAQKRGAKRFRQSLRRFITLGSPLDKVGFLFGEDALRPWTEEDRICFWDHTQVEDVKKRIANKEDVIDWWVNFYHVFDPVSGALSNSTVCGSRPPRNFHASFWRIPGLAHLAYWSDSFPLRYILGRIYGSALLKDGPFDRQNPTLLTLYAVVGYVVWAGIIVGGVYFIFKYFWALLRMLIGIGG